jgi:UDP-N-acetylmuramate: L-alanyl-gamma-D-glutamyl-meso-diaminopimelate ligase
MNSISEISDYSQNKTRVLIYASNPAIAQLVLQVLDFHGKNTDFFLQNGQNETLENDFVVLETSEVQKAAEFRPNIVLMTEDFGDQDLSLLLKNIIPGGVLIYPETSEIFFRKLPFSRAGFKKNSETFVLNTELGDLPLLSANENLIENINGIKLLCQQFGVMEEEFYEPVMNFV